MTCEAPGGGVRREVDPTRRLSVASIGLVAVIVAAEISGHLVDFGVYRLRVTALNANLGSSPVAWVGPAAILIALVASLVLLPARRGVRAARWLPVVLAVILVLATRHIGESLPYWQVVLLPPLSIAFLLLWQTGSRDDRLASRMVRAGCVFLVLAFALHVLPLSAFRQLGVAVHSWPYQIKVAVKEGTEICGWMLIAGGLGVTALTEARRRRAAPAGGHDRAYGQS